MPELSVITHSRAAAIDRVVREQEAIVAKISDAEPEELYVLIERLEKLDTTYAWLLDHVPRGSAI